MQMFLLFAWVAISFYQMFLGYGTAYRLTKQGGDNGISLFGWSILMSAAAIIPGLGFYLWNKYKNIDVPQDKFSEQFGTSSNTASTSPIKGKSFFGFGRSEKRDTSQKANQNITCDKCGREYESYLKVCPGCGKRDLDRRHD